MSRQNVELVRKLYERWERGDFATGDAFDPQAAYSRIGGEGAGLSGEWCVDEIPGALREYFRAFEGLRLEGDEFIDLDSDRVLVLSRHRGVGRLSGAPYEQAAADVFTLRDGLIVRLETYWDRSEAMRAAGLAE